MTIEELAEIGGAIIRLRKDYSRPASREMTLDFPLYAYLEASYGNLSRQLGVTVAGQDKRIDFRIGGYNPVVIEFVVRPPQGGGQLYGSQNQSELAKLTRVQQSHARTRVLLLLDLSQHFIERAALRATYVNLHAGPGRFHRRSVRVVYVHHDGWYHFLWHPNA